MKEFCNNMELVYKHPNKVYKISERYCTQMWIYHHLSLISLCRKANDQTDRNKRNIYSFGPGVQTSQEGVQNTSSRSLDANMLA